ncbi:protein Spindly-A-like [Mizuhopecten yessoensis]|uniref:Protein Spindly-A n=1 Tax=Mizuhopecten yessoensis TaxID=6573 RepID=A0A210PG30_MIZYE|nr:protein Spindly-A-like [Mizuhopecten yessoensis]XP_021342496.1 protein Spindly-A-like [Mizuhopecten yessoensis]OWF35442.1 Protein Spindly-A [Mizuhopecten yessoensis]
MDEIAELESKLHTAATIGNCLLEENSSLKDEREKLIKEHSKNAEEWEQEKYSLVLKVESKVDTEKWYKGEIAQMKRDMTRLNEDMETKMEIEKSKMQQQVRLVSKIQSELDQSRSVESQLRDQISQLEELMERKMNQTADITSRSFDSEEMADLQIQIVNLLEENKNLEKKCIDICTEVQQYKSEQELLTQGLARKDEEIEEIQCQTSSYALSLERARTEIVELRLEMDVMRDSDASHGVKGNSLFSEVEDRRVDAEKKLISLKHKCEAQELISKKQTGENRNLRNQMMILLHSSRGEADGDRIKQLESQLSQARSKITQLNEEKYTLEKKMKSQTENFSERFAAMEPNEQCDKAGDKAFTNYLITMVKTKDQENENLQSELRDAELQLLDTKNEKSKLERKLHNAESEREKIHNKCLRMQLKYDELQQKYDPESVKNKGVSKKKYITEKLQVDVVPEQTINVSRTEAPPRPVSVQSINTSRSENPLRPVMEGNKLPTKDSKSNMTVLDAIPKKGVSSKVRSVSIADSVMLVDSDGEKRTGKLSSNCDRENKEKLMKESAPLKPKGQRMTKVIKPCEETDNTEACKTQ